MTVPGIQPPRYRPSRLVMVALVFVLLAPVFWLMTQYRPTQAIEGPGHTELFTRVYPELDYAFGRLKHGDIPLWAGEIHCGYPLHTDPRIGLWQPLNAIFLLVPTQRALAIQGYAALALMGFGFALFVRALGAGYLAGMFGGAVFAFCGASAGALSNPGAVAVLAWTPWAFWMATEFLRRRSPGSAILLGVFGALMILGGSWGLAAAFGILLLLFLVFGIIVPAQDAQHSALRSICLLVVSGVVAVGLSAIQWVPSIWSGLHIGMAAFWNVEPAAQVPAQARAILSQVLVATPGNLPRLGYLGAITLALIWAGLVHRSARCYAIFLLCVALVSWALWLFLPDRFAFGFPSAAFAYTGVFAWAVMAALGLDALLTPEPPTSVFARFMPLVIAAVVACLWFVVAPSLTRGYLLVFVVVALVIVLVRTRETAVAGAFILIALLFIDLAMANGNRYRHPFADAPQIYQKYEPALERAKAEAAGYRVLISGAPNDSALTENIGLIDGLKCAGGSGLPQSPAQNAWWQRNADSVQFDLLRLMSVKAIVAGPGSALYDSAWTTKAANWQQVQVEGEARVFVSNDALPRAYWVPRARPAGTQQDAIEIVSAADFHARRSCVGEFLVKNSPALSLPSGHAGDESDFGTCSVEEASPEQLMIHVDAPYGGLVVLTDAFAKGWQATLDGQQTPIFRTNGLFRSVFVAGGQQNITYTYRPQPFYAGAIVTTVTLVLTILAGVVICLGLVREG